MICTNPTCRHDDQPRQVLDTALLCVPCRRRLTRNIEGLPHQFAQLSQWLTRTGGGGEKVSGSQTHGLQLNEDVSEHRAKIRAAVASWSRVIVEERGVNPPATAEIQATAPFLARHSDWLAYQPFANEVYTEIAELRREAFGLMRTPGRGPIHLAACPEHECGGDLWTIIRFEWDREPWQIWCSYCLRTWDTTQFMKLGQRLGKPFRVMNNGLSA